MTDQLPLPYYFKLSSGRNSLLELITPNSKCAEIGVFKGDFSSCILDQSPSELNLIDPWNSIMDIPARWHAIPQDDMDEIFKEVSSRFSTEPKVNIIKKYSVDALDHFEDESLDWVYLDANHSYSFVSQDLDGWWTKLKPQGFLCGNAYIDGDAQLRLLDFGVIPAVDSFLEDRFDEIEDFDNQQDQFCIQKK